VKLALQIREILVRHSNLPTAGAWDREEEIQRLQPPNGRRAEQKQRSSSPKVGDTNCWVSMVCLGHCSIEPRDATGRCSTTDLNLQPGLHFLGWLLLNHTEREFLFMGVEIISEPYREALRKT
jgi:hypothetical protein